MRTFAPAFEQNGQSCTASSLGIPQGGNAAAGSCPPASLAQLARARDL